MGSKSENRKKFGVGGGRIPATRVLVMDLEHFQKQGIDGKALIAINDVEGTFTSANVYDGNLGKNYDASGMTHPLPEAKSDKWKEWTKKGYVAGSIADFDVLEAVESEETSEAPKEEATA